MRRREFISFLGGALAAWPFAAQAQQSPPIPVIGYLDTASASTTAHVIAAFRQGLAAAGYEEGRNVVVEYRWARGRLRQAAELGRRFGSTQCCGDRHNQHSVHTGCQSSLGGPNLGSYLDSSLASCFLISGLSYRTTFNSEFRISSFPLYSI
jgi:hypothetical protein